MAMQSLSEPRAGAHKITWTVEMIVDLRRYAAEGLSAEQIARKFKTTRNSVCAKCGRLRLALKGVNSQRGRPAGNTVRPAVRVGSDNRRLYALPPTKPLPVAVDEPPGLCTIHTLTLMSCRWPIGEPSADMTYCGKTKERGSYCGAHHLISSGGLPPQRKRRAA